MKRINRHDVERAERQLRARGIHVREVGRKVLHDYGGQNTEAGHAMHFPIGSSEIDVTRVKRARVRIPR